MTIEARLRAEASALGFSACGFAVADPVPRGAFFDGWLAAGFAGEMRYLERRPERRLTIQGLLPGARSVISLAYPYGAPPPAPFDVRQQLRGRIAAYALGVDYHRVVGDRLAHFESFLAGQCPTERTRRYVDTGAVLEREWAVRGGLGWFGKNTMLLSTRAGSWFFLAELVTTLQLVPDSPSRKHCGRCTRCQASCPTEALGDELVMDARRCISYLTIEHRGPIPRQLRPQVGSWIFGCDVCQEVCPWNAKAESSSLHAPATGPWSREFTPPPRPHADVDDLYPRLPELLALDREGFHARFGHTAIARAQRRGLLRNVAVALGNSGNPAAVPPLIAALDDPEPLVRSHAAWALGSLGTAEGRRALERRRAMETDGSVLAEIAAAMAPDPPAVSGR